MSLDLLCSVGAYHIFCSRRENFSAEFPEASVFESHSLVEAAHFGPGIMDNGRNCENMKPPQNPNFEARPRKNNKGNKSAGEPKISVTVAFLSICVNVIPEG